MTPRKRTEIFAYICHFIFAIIIANSYETATEVFINPGWTFLTDSSALTSALELFLAYVIAISGWVGYARSMTKWPHADTKAGTVRFVLDITILFGYFWLISSAGTQNEFDLNFLYWIVGLFSMFIVWDTLKRSEHIKKYEGSNNSLDSSLLKTGIFLGIFVFVTIGYNLLLENQVGIINKEIIYPGTLILCSILVIIYRYVKWAVPSKKRKINKATNSEL